MGRRAVDEGEGLATCLQLIQDYSKQKGGRGGVGGGGYMCLSFSLYMLLYLY